MLRHAAQHYPSSLELEEEQDVVCRQASPREHLHGKEVGSCEYGHVRPNELFPPRILAAFRCRPHPVPAENVADGLIRHVVSDVGQGSRDPVVAPGRVLAGEADDQLFGLTGDPRPTGLWSALGPIELRGNQSAVPAQDGIGFSRALDLGQRFASHSLADLGQSGALRI